MKTAGILVLVGSLAFAGLLFVIWLVGLVAHIGGGLIHLLLLLAIIVGPVGVVAGVLLILLGKRSGSGA